MTMRDAARVAIVGAAVGLSGMGATALAGAQSFGQNKVQYDKFDFKVLATEHFDIHYYSSEEAAAQEVARMSERWYARLSQVLGHQLTGRQVVVLYGSHPEFEQTNVVEGLIDEGTGGVTESARRRVVLPLAATLGETDHVLGHELVHAFQYDILGRNAEGVPLWFIEGMAEYLSLGPRHVQTALWLRDAAREDRLPNIKDLDDPRFFPYRFGHAFWAYIGGRWGDAQIGTILKRLVSEPGSVSVGGGGIGAVGAIEAATSEKQDALSTEWHQEIRSLYQIEARDKNAPPIEGEVVIGRRAGGGNLNVGPSMSPDGKKIAYLSEQSRLAIDLYVADARTGDVLQKLTKSEVDPHFQSLQFLASAGAWDPTSKQLAVATVRSGRPVIAIFDVDSGKDVREIKFAERGEIFQPTWSPDGKSIAFSAQVGGVTDLFLCDLGSGQIRRLTNDSFADLQPVWTPDGHQLAFVTDRFSSDLATLSFGEFDLGLIDIGSGAMSKIETGVNGDKANPQWSKDGQTLYFIADAKGKPDIYRVATGTTNAVQLTDEITGVTGITALSPAFSVATNTGRSALTVFRASGYEIVFMDAAREATSIAASQVADEAALPPAKRASSLVAQELAQPKVGLPEQKTIAPQPYKTGWQLVDATQQAGAVSGGAFGTYITGGVSFLFQDVLGNQMISTTASVNGSVRDFGAEAAYINRSSRWTWGFFGGRVPVLSGSSSVGTVVSNGQVFDVQQTELDRQIYTEVGALTAYPISRATRVEFTGSVQRIGFQTELQTDVYDAFTGQFLSSQRDDLGSQPSLSLGEVAAAWVRDTSAPGAVGPILGQRIRFEVAPNFGDLRMTNVSSDVRQYIMPFRPVTFAGRALHLARYGASSEDTRLVPMFLGYSEFVRGYDPNSFQAADCVNATAVSSCPAFDQLLGSRMVVINGEARIPVGGLFTGNLDYGPVPAELFAFFDAGTAWTKAESPQFAGGTRTWVRSVGFGARVNLLGFAIGEFNMVHPIDRPTQGWRFVFNLRPSF